MDILIGLAACTLALQPAYTPLLRKQWSVNVNRQLARFVVQGDSVFYGNSADYGAIDLTTGKRLWESHFSDSGFRAYVAVDRSTLYVAVGKQEIRACDPRTGQIRWRYPLKGYGHVLYAAENLLLFQDTEGVLTALDTQAQRLKWLVDLQGKQKKRSGIVQMPLVQGERVFVGTSDGTLSCLNRSTGKPLWRHPFSAASPKIALEQLSADTKRLYATTSEGLFALDPRTGRTLWQNASFGSVVVPEGDVLYGTNGNYLDQLGATDGKLRWSQPLPATEDFTDLSPPLVGKGEILLTVNNDLLAFSSDGKKLGQWDTEQRLSRSSLSFHRDGLLITSSHEFLYFRSGLPLGPPEDPTLRKALAEQIAARFAKRSWDDYTMFRKLGVAGFEALYPSVAQALRKPADSTTDVRDFLERLGEVMQPEHTEKVLDLLPLIPSQSTTDYTRMTTVGLLATHADRRARDFFLKALQQGPEGKDFGGAIPYFMRLPDPEATAFLRNALQDPAASPSLRSAAFYALPSMGDPTVFPLLRSLRFSTRALPTVAEFYALKSPKATAKDSRGTLWGLFNCPALGGYDDLWVARRQGDEWVDFLFTGSSEQDSARKNKDGTVLTYPKDWLTRYALNPALRVDRDHDGLTDLAEKRLGTDPTNPDTDGDGLPDSQDKNPLAGRLPTTEEEKVLAAAFESQFGFGKDRGFPLIVAFPAGMAPFELPCAGWLVLPKASSSYWGTSRYTPLGHVLVSFVNPMRRTSPVFRWNADRTEATVHLGIVYGALDGVGYDIRVRKFGNDWFVMEKKASWFS